MSVLMNLFENGFIISEYFYENILLFFWYKETFAARVMNSYLIDRQDRVVSP